MLLGSRFEDLFGMGLFSISESKEIAQARPSRGHKPKSSEREDEILHLLSHHGFLAVPRPVHVTVGNERALNEQLPVVGLDKFRAIRTRVPFKRFVIADQVLPQMF